MARPLNRTNHSATSVVPISDSDPCPSVRMAANPAYSSQGLSTWLIHSAAKPNRMPTVAEKPKPMACDHQGREIGKPVA